MSQISIATTEMSTAVDHSALVDEDALRTSSRNSRRSEEKNPLLDKSQESGGSGGHDNTNNTSNDSCNDEAVFVKPTKPAPKKAKKQGPTPTSSIVKQEM